MFLNPANRSVHAAGEETFQCKTKRTKTLQIIIAIFRVTAPCEPSGSCRKGWNTNFPSSANRKGFCRKLEKNTTPSQKEPTKKKIMIWSMVFVERCAEYAAPR